MPEFDGIASIGISLVLGGTAVFLARESKDLLIGEQARIATRKSILRIARDHSGVTGVGQLITVHLAPDQIVAGLNIDFDNQRHASEVETIVNLLETQIRKTHPDVIALFIKPHSGLNASHT